jgi:hypothetical protein
MAKNKLLVLAGVLLVFCVGFALTRFDHKAGKQPQQPAVPIRGEPIQPLSPQGELPPTNTTIADSSTKRRHPKPPSVQRRMVLAQLAQADGSDSNNTALASGTLGTAADLAKTNLFSASSLPAIHVPGFTEVNFSTLGGYDLALNGELAGTSANPARTAAEVQSRIPQDVQGLDGKKIIIQGFLLPVKMDDGLAVEFLLMRNQSMCCYGVPPKINEWITVRMNGKGVKAIMDQPIAVAGTLHVGPIQENGLLTGVYEMEAEKVTGPL